MANNKKQLNEFSLIAILGTIALFGWISGFFNKLADEVDAYSNNRSVELNNALKKIVNSLGNNNSFLAKIDDFVEKYGIGNQMITAIMNTKEVKSEVEKYKNDKEFNLDTLTSELTTVLSKAMYDEARNRGIVAKMDKKIKNTNWK